MYNSLWPEIGTSIYLVNWRAGGFTAGSKTAQDAAMLRLSRLQIWDQGIETPLLVEALCWICHYLASVVVSHDVPPCAELKQKLHEICRCYDRGVFMAGFGGSKYPFWWSHFVEFVIICLSRLPPRYGKTCRSKMKTAQDLSMLGPRHLCSWIWRVQRPLLVEAFC
jgi:hypothetical protein